ncbi:hypoxanthine phosphoribosyltransferase [Bacteroides sp. 4_3_47FAA]|uniref:Hypoxanthine phosphoribosyltransferase n=8 Tax=Bacteria TaxID=2 RepID=A0A0P0LBR0_PHOVU|nr:putative hypoxanthine guanine phosphoribosyltransferase [Phocaeicola vulgatus]EET17844.1 hypoxanthine phosphoribosyltransferase [Bacteroides sp. 4_3_47FAA]
MFERTKITLFTKRGYVNTSILGIKMLFLQQFNKIAVMDTIQIKDKRFTPFIPEERILKEVARVASEINRDLEGTNPLFLSVLNGAFMFAADLMRNLTIPSEISFVKLASYAGTSSTGKVKELVGLNDDIEGRTVVIVEDIVDTGVTMKHLLETLQARKPKEIRIATLLLKPDKLKVELDIHYVAMRIPNDFIVGYGLDYDGLGRNYRDIYTVME